SLRLFVAERLLRKAINPGNGILVEEQDLAAKACGLGFVRAMHNDLQGMGQLLAKLSPSDAFQFATTLESMRFADAQSNEGLAGKKTESHDWSEAASGYRNYRPTNNPHYLSVSDAHSLVLAAVNGVTPTKNNHGAISAITTKIHDLIRPEDFKKTP